MFEYSFAFEIIKGVCDYIREKKCQRKMERMESYMAESRNCMIELRRYMEMNSLELGYSLLCDLQTREREKLRDLRQKLIHLGELELAEEVNYLIEEDCRLPENSFVILRSYLGY
ncbi:hypothetical protein SAMN04490178_13434 [Propionispora vibrioides]|uniref:Uncharacterized protein n=2 Tax=Propionispora vibrioides TaxID=112903 RepID=A0A1H8XYQ8_9FIRM|nr:hypothetical protein SAMN04490178_13434 [Propionispora vibrioides]